MVLHYLVQLLILMPTIVLETKINAPAEVCFDLMRDARLHAGTTRFDDGSADGQVCLGQIVTFASERFGFKQRLTVKVIECERPRLFVDEMTAGFFKSFRHVHEFLPLENGVLLKDTFIWTSPFGIFGKILDRLLIEKHLRSLATGRNAKLKEIAENAVKKGY